jgi:hypothetical protein
MSITLDELIFDPSNPDDGANVGATLRGADGTVIGNTGDAIKVDIGAVADLDIRDLNASQDNVAISDGTDTLAINADGSINATVAATDLDIRDLAFATDSVDVSGSSVTVSATDLDIRDLSFATDSVDVSGSAVTIGGKSSGQYKAAAVNTTAAQIDTSPLANRKNITIQNLGTKEVWIGFDGSVTASNGTKIPRGGSADFDWSDSLSVFAVTASGTADVRLLETA